MRKLAIVMALASTAIASPVLAKDKAWYVGVEGGAMLVEDMDLDIGARTTAPITAAGTEVAQSNAIYEYEPDAASILTDLVPRNLSVQIFRALLENVAGEMGAKMSAMDNATRNAGEMINKLTLSYNRQRQAQITKELIEIISGAEAL